MDDKFLSTGFRELDSVLENLHVGDNVVWLTPSILEYKIFVDRFVENITQNGDKIVYFRFASHPALVSEINESIIIENVSPELGFEKFTISIYNKIAEYGEGTFYVFDCLSDLLAVWKSDITILNFFSVICPFLYRLNTVAYFALLKYYHSIRTRNGIRKTTQLFLELYNDMGVLYVHPHKVFERGTPTMFLPHKFDGVNRFEPVVNSIEATRLFSTLCSVRGEQATRFLDMWDRLFINAESVMSSGNESDKSSVSDNIIKVMIGKEERVRELASKHFTVSDLIEINNRLIGTGFIGGKAVGVLLARKILANDASFDWGSTLEPHDSFFIGSDVFHSFIVYNGWWDIFINQKTEDGYFSAGEELEKLFPTGKFPFDIEEKIKNMLEYFGQYPIVLRSSSLLEDGFGNAFAGKYESFFCSVIGSPEERYDDFINLLKAIYASAMSRDALVYRKERGLQNADEQMAVLVQRVSGCYHGHYYYPNVAGVGLSYNTYVWDKEIDPKAGMLRIVMGLGTRAVNRVDGDYPRIVSLSDPLKIPISDINDLMKYSQRDLDVLDVHARGKHYISLLNILKNGQIHFDMNLIGTRDWGAERRIAERKGSSDEIWILTFERLLKSEFPEIMKNMMAKLENEYENPVDIEFTVNFTGDGNFLINLLQCRPLQRNIVEGHVEKPENICPDNVLISSEGQFMGGSVHFIVNRMIFVDPEKYTKLDTSDKFKVARAIGKLNRISKDVTTALFGPGRWGTTTPSLGVPVNFSEINNISVLAEIEYEAGGLYPELSFGSHFFQDLVENETFYLAVFPNSGESVLKMDLINSLGDISCDLLDDEEHIIDVINVYDTGDNVFIFSDISTQEVLFYKS